MSLFKFPVTSRHSLQLQVKLEYYNLLPITNALERTTLPILHAYRTPPPPPCPHLLRIKVYLLKYIEQCPPHPLPNEYCPHCIIISVRPTKRENGSQGTSEDQIHTMHHCMSVTQSIPLWTARDTEIYMAQQLELKVHHLRIFSNKAPVLCSSMYKREKQHHACMFLT